MPAASARRRDGLRLSGTPSSWRSKGDDGNDEEEEEENQANEPSAAEVRNDPFSRGWELRPQDRPLVLGEYMSNRYPERPTTLEITDIGDILLRRGVYPDPTQEPLWAHRVTGAFGGRANGGCGCAVEAFWQQYINTGREIPVTLSVKNGRWRVGRGVLCTLGRSPAPEGSLRRFIPGDERGKAIREGYLYLFEDDTVVLGSPGHVFWDSFYG